MTESTSRRDAAVKAFQDREERAKRTAADQARQREDDARRQQDALTTWRSETSAMVHSSVMNVSEDFARRKSPLMFRHVMTDGIMVRFELRRSGEPTTALSDLTFNMDPNGLVFANTRAQGASLPAPVLVGEITSDWVEQIAEEVMMTVLEGGGMRVPD